jgi:hypothetical protein
MAYMRLTVTSASIAMSGSMYSIFGIAPAGAALPLHRGWFAGRRGTYRQGPVASRLIIFLGLSQCADKAQLSSTLWYTFRAVKLIVGLAATRRRIGHMLNVNALCVDLVPEKPPVSITAGVNLARFNLQAGCLQQQSAAVFQRLLQPSGVLFRHHNRRPHLRGPQMVSCSPRAWSGLPMFLADQLGGYPEFKATG